MARNRNAEQRREEDRNRDEDRDRLKAIEMHVLKLYEETSAQP